MFELRLSPVTPAFDERSEASDAERFVQSGATRRPNNLPNDLPTASAALRTVKVLRTRCAVLLARSSDSVGRLTSNGFPVGHDAPGLIFQGKEYDDSRTTVRESHASRSRRMVTNKFLDDLRIGRCEHQLDYDPVVFSILQVRIQFTIIDVCGHSTALLRTAALGCLNASIKSFQDC